MVDPAGVPAELGNPIPDVPLQVKPIVYKGSEVTDDLTIAFLRDPPFPPGPLKVIHLLRGNLHEFTDQEIIQPQIVAARNPAEIQFVPLQHGSIVGQSV